MKHHGCAKVMSFQMRLFWQISLIQRLKFTESRQGLEAPTSSLSGYFFFHVDMLPTLDGTTFQEWFLLVHHLDQNVATSSKLHPYLDSSTQKCPKKVPNFIHLLVLTYHHSWRHCPQMWIWYMWMW